MDSFDQILLRELEKGIPLQSHPYSIIGERIGMAWEEVIQRIENLKQAGVIRRIRARINQRSVGIIANALVGWKIPEEETDNVGKALAALPGVTHCYQRSIVPGRWEYSLYTVHHGWSHEQVTQEIRMIAEKTGFHDYIILFSTDEYKRTPHTRVDDLERVI
ncbi:MAG: Lrp/AsnC family transcriptional regulator [Methanomicrobiales archaeon]|nr:Lrp/AsnC family transcriptional regulator [Methanomicrobiales archaeon]